MGLDLAKGMIRHQEHLKHPEHQIVITIRARVCDPSSVARRAWILASWP
jgi:hypothetical protein